MVDHPRFIIAPPIQLSVVAGLEPRTEGVAIDFQFVELLLQLGRRVLQFGGLRDGLVPLSGGLDQLTRQLRHRHLPVLLPGALFVGRSENGFEYAVGGR